MAQEFGLDIRCFELPPELQPYFTSIHSFSVDCGDGEFVEDYIHPEWAAMRFSLDDTRVRSGFVPDELQEYSTVAINGPTSRALRFAMPKVHFFTVGLQPAGWARFIDPPASDFANTIVEGSHQAFSAFAPLLHKMRDAKGNAELAAASFTAFLQELNRIAKAAPERVLVCQEALKDPQLRDVEQLCGIMQVGRRTLERMCARYFGFPPKTLIRRQRFLRSLGRFVALGQTSWSDALDMQYVDQAHFVRDFRSFMGMTPTQYARLPHPVLDRIIKGRIADLGALPSTDLPTVFRYTGNIAHRSGKAIGP